MRFPLVVIAMGWLGFPPCLSGQGGPVADAIVGIWKGVEVPAESRDAVSGAGIALVGWFGQLKLRADGRYEFEEYREGELAGCQVAIRQRSRGVARTDGAVLTLDPTETFETKRDGCAPGTVAERPVTGTRQRFGVALAWTETIAGWETLRLTATAMDRGDEAYVFHLVRGVETEWPAAVLPESGRQDRVPAALTDTWEWPAGAANIVDLVSRNVQPPDRDAHWLELSPDGRYTFAAWRASLVPGPGCTLGALRYERGRYTVTVREYESQQALTVTPDTAATVTVLSECGTDDGIARLDQPLWRSRFGWGLGRTVDGDEALELRCSTNPRERNRWQFLLCHWGFEFRTLLSRRR